MESKADKGQSFSYDNEEWMTIQLKIFPQESERARNERHSKEKEKMRKFQDDLA
jgi:hypothetical protein